MRKKSEKHLWQFYIDKGKGEEEVGRKWCKHPWKTLLYKIMKEASEVTIYGYRVIEKETMV